MPKPFFITTAIDYTNAAPHIGHAYEKILADVLARYHRLKGEEVFFLTGVDQHGQKVQQSAEKQGIAPQAFVDGITAKFRALWDKLDVQYTGWAATTDPLHQECVRANLQRLWDEKDPGTGESRWLYKAKQSGYYSIRQEQFLTDKERGPDGEFGPEWGEVELREEENFYFRLSAHKPWLLDLIDSRSAAGQPFVIPEFRVTELRNAVEKLEGDLCISRPAARLQWGIPFPESFGAGFVTYVWFDALVNYISFVPGHDPHHRKAKGERREAKVDASFAFSPSPFAFSSLWPPLHVIGKDIMIPAHGVYWPIMLKALGFADDEMPTLLVHGWWNIAGAKMSKSVGNSVDPDVLADKYGAEAVRYYLMSDIATGKDADFSEERLVQRYNSDLANSLGNLLNRTLNMTAKYRSQSLKFPTYDEPVLAECRLSFPALIGYFEEWFDRRFFGNPYQISLVLDLMFGRGRSDIEFIAFPETVKTEDGREKKILLSELGVSLCNRLVEKTSPWSLAKDPAQSEKLDAVLYHLAESLRIIAILISPVLPKAAQGIFDQLNWKMDEAGQESRFQLADATWGGLPDGHQLGKPVPLFPRLEAPL